ncbi:hypothetical protein [Staphylococcus saprophyticus]|uniref:hypothetical protein n=1 Tax=Staphylococcus saprophyticus TaxID=29385 RepID=UPI0008538F07|nr:hypothetical protein [Staphylococcus saprophyticus]AVK72410.1 hypothetical protein CEQ14_01185 [Staphylococcus saprophyticus]MCM3120148.1 hypothetical protein [Staphylococcus saprophyticus]MDW3878666.1 hypothetical protein [Staphylococcus saprophyticus]MDW3921078.1 hypothetical protein [Staphylococcus saprophyticus]MDW4019660.1 hypothetical protein [Staphylococcus saprophyticus]
MKFLKDITLNIASQAMFIAVQQLLLFPVFEKNLGQSNFGWFLLIYGIFNVFTVTIATSFTNLYQKKFNILLDELNTRVGYYGYYKKLLVYFLILVIIFSVSICFTKIDLLNYVLLALLVIFTASRMFLMVWYRVQKKFTIILVVNLLLSSMYACLYFISINNVVEILIAFIVIEFIINIFIYLLNKVNFIHLINSKIEKFEMISLNLLMLSGFSASLMNYSDRFIINILLGASSITVFYIASLPTKLMLFPFNMISSVILSYLANTESINKSLKNKVLIFLPGVYIGVFIITYFIGIFIIRIIYPQYLDDVLDIYLYVTLTFGFICVDYIIRSFLLKYYSLLKKAMLDVLTLLTFLLLSIMFNFVENSISSIAIAQLLTFAIKVFIEIIIFIKLDTKI